MHLSAAKGNKFTFRKDRKQKGKIFTWNRCTTFWEITMVRRWRKCSFLQKLTSNKNNNKNNKPFTTMGVQLYGSYFATVLYLSHVLNKLSNMKFFSIVSICVLFGLPFLLLIWISSIKSYLLMGTLLVSFLQVQRTLNMFPSFWPQ